MWQSKYFSSGEASVIPHLYDHCTALTASDHKPVVSSFTVKVQRPIKYTCSRVKEPGLVPDADLNFTRVFAISGATDEQEIERVLADPATVGLQYLPPVFYVTIAEPTADEDSGLIEGGDAMSQLREMIAAEDAKKNGQITKSGDGSTGGAAEAITSQGEILFRFAADTLTPFLDHPPWTDVCTPPKIEARSAADDVDVAAAVAEAVAEARASAKFEASSNTSASANEIAVLQQRARSSEAEHQRQVAEIQQENKRLLAERDASIAQLQGSIRAQRQDYTTQVANLEREQRDLIARLNDLRTKTQIFDRNAEPASALSASLAAAQTRVAALEQQLFAREQQVQRLEFELTQARAAAANRGDIQRQMQAAFDQEIAGLRAQVSALIEGFRGLVPDEMVDRFSGVQSSALPVQSPPPQAPLRFQASRESASPMLARGANLDPNADYNRRFSSPAQRFSAANFSGVAPSSATGSPVSLGYSRSPPLAQEQHHSRSQEQPERNLNHRLSAPAALPFQSLPAPASRPVSIAVGEPRDSRVPTLSTEWFYRTSPDSEVYGPFDREDMEYWFENGDLPSNLLVCNGQTGAWVELSSLGQRPFSLP